MITRPCACNVYVSYQDFLKREVKVTFHHHNAVTPVFKHLPISVVILVFGTDDSCLSGLLKS